MIAAEDLKFIHQGAEAPVLERLSFKIERGRRAVLLGPNGCGKSTLFMCLSGLWPISRGVIYLDGHNLESLAQRQRARLMAVVPQSHVPQFSYTVFEAVLMGRAPYIELYASPSAEDRDIARAALARLGLEHLSDRPYTRISGGERQLVLLARALAQQSPIVLLDEPTSHLDFKNQYGILDLIAELAGQAGLTILMTLHDPNLAAFFADQVLTLAAGRIGLDGPPQDILSEENLSALYQARVGVLEHGSRRLIFSKRKEESQGAD